MDDDYIASLFERVRERCRQEAQYPEQFGNFARMAVHVRSAASTSTGLLWPPAPEAQLQTTEAQLGFFLPPLLRQLYAKVGNGGFGPGYGIVGVVGGAPHPDNWFQNIAEGYTQAAQYLDLSTIRSSKEQGKWFEIDQGIWPRQLIAFCSWGCNTMHAINVQTGEVFVEDSGRYFANWVPSLEEWLEQWLDGTLAQQ